MANLYMNEVGSDMDDYSNVNDAAPQRHGDNDPYPQHKAPVPETTQAQRSEVMRVREVFRYLEPWESKIHPTMVSKPLALDQEHEEIQGEPKGQTQSQQQQYRQQFQSRNPEDDDDDDDDERNIEKQANPDKKDTPPPLEPEIEWTPVGCEDTALAAFAQLGALRLDAQRCIISLVSKDQEVILAESTKTLSLQSDVVHARNDELWLGTTSFPRNEGMASIGLRQWKKTIKTRDLPDDQGFYYTDSISKHWHVISDMRQHSELHARLFVRCAKALRFYASVPIRTPSGTVIGAYAVIDDKPRFGISARDMEFLEDIADTVMGHLEAKRAMVQRQRGDRLVKGLALFNGGKTSLREWWLANYSRNQRGEGQRRRRRSSSEEEMREERADEEFGQTYRATDLDARGRLIHNSNVQSPDEETDAHEPGKILAKASPHSNDKSAHLGVSEESKKVTPTTSHNSAPNRHPTTETTMPIREPVEVAKDTIASVQAPSPKLEGFDLQRETEDVFARASNLMREALNAEGVMFIDTDFPRSEKNRRGRYKKGVRERDQGQSLPNPDGDVSSPATATEAEESGDTDNSFSSPQSQAPGSMNAAIGSCNLLGFSTKIRSSLRGFQPSQKQSSLSKGVMNRLLRRYPYGKIFNYHNGKSLSSSSAGEASGSTRDSGHDASSPVPHAKTKSKEAKDAAALAELVSEPRSVAFLPLWDDQRERWRAGILIWNAAPNRFLDLEEDVTYMAAFGNSLMSELARLQVIAADQAKATFISSVSHELRSPLHGVLAGVEFLQESKLDSYQKEMTTTISMAGKTLLQTIENILDFTKINAFTDTQRSNRKSKDRNRHMSFKSADVGEVGVTRQVDLAALTEDVVNTLVTASQFRASIIKKNLYSSRRSSTVSSLSRKSLDTEDSDDQIAVVLDIEKNPTWNINTSPGSWTRIITNIVGNSFKYTKSGTISIILKIVKPTRNGETQVQLVVEDTGQGISEDFQKHHLWTPFMQENTHAVGTGLGLSIVKQVVEDMGGRIIVASEVGRGTKITVSLASEPIKQKSSSDVSDFEAVSPRNIKTAVLTPPGKSAQARRDRQVCSVVAKTCRAWMDCSVENIKGSPEDSSADICFMAESDYDQWLQQKRLKGDINIGTRSDRRSRPGPPMIVLSSETDPKARRRATQDRNGVLFLNQPFGPRKLARAIKASLESGEVSKTPRSTAKGRSNMRDITEEDAGCSSASISSSPKSGISTPERQQSPWDEKCRHIDTHHDGDEDVSPPTEETEAESETKPEDEPISPNPSLGSILLVEDNPVNMKLLIAAMRKLDRPFMTAENGLEAVQKYACTPAAFSLVLMDMSMPIMDGFTATETIRTMEEKNRWKRCKIIALTGVASADARQNAFTSGVDTFLSKPASMQKLKGLIEELDG